MSNDNLALLATATYAKFTDISDSDRIQKNLIDIKLSKEQAKKFTDTYDIIAHQSNTASGNSGTLVINCRRSNLI